MKNLSFKDAFKNTKNNKGFKFPSIEDERFQDTLLFPMLTPKFKINKNEKVFTIGSCFARNVEKYLMNDFTLPTLDIDVKDMCPVRSKRGNGILNEFNAGTISQRINWAINNISSSDLKHGLFEDDSGTEDFLIPTGNHYPNTNLDTVLEARKRIDDVYKNLSNSDTLFLTLGLTESWFDLEHDCYLNSISPKLIRKKQESERFVFVNLDFDTSFNLLSKSFDLALDSGIKKIIVTVSPVPLFKTFTSNDAVVASSRSKSILKIVAHKLKDTFKDKIEYFPSYEIVKSGGTSSFLDDNVHVKDEVVERVIQYFINEYVSID
jgi:hypothetical protein